MKITKLTAVIGVLAIIVAIVLFLGWWVVLLEPVQLKIVNKEMVLNKTILYVCAVGVAFICNTLWMVGTKFLGARKFNQEYIEFKGAFARKDYWVMLAWVTFAIVLFTFFWTLGL